VLFNVEKQVIGMIECDNMRCRFNKNGMCTITHLIIEEEHCVCFKLKHHRQKKTNQTDINHEPVRYGSRNRVLK